MVMWDIAVNEAEDLIKEHIEKWIRNKISNVTVYGGRWKNLYDDSILGISREQALVYDKVPFIILKIDTVGENLIGFGGNYFKRERITDFLVDKTNFDITLKKESLFTGSSGKRYRYVLLPDMFNVPSNVNVDELLPYLQNESESNVVVTKDENTGKIYFVFKNELYIYIENDEIFDLPVNSKISGKLINYNGMILSGVLNISIGCESVRTRSELKDVLTKWIDEVRMNDGVVGNDRVNVILNSLGRGRGDNDIVIGGGDSYRMLFMSGMDVNVVIENTIDTEYVSDDFASLNLAYFEPKDP